MPQEIDISQIQIPEDAIQALEKGSKIEAIKCIRQSNGVGLYEAKQAVEVFLDKNPGIKVKLDAANSGALQGLIGWAVLLIALGYASYYLLAA